MSHLESVLLHVVGQSGSHKVAAAAMGAVRDLVAAHIHQLSPPFWQAVWAATDRAVTTATEKKDFDSKAVREVLKVLGEIQVLAESGSGLLDRSNVLCRVRLLDRLAFTLSSSGKGPSPLQTEVLEDLKNVTNSFPQQPEEDQAALWICTLNVRPEIPEILRTAISPLKSRVLCSR